MKSFYSNAFRMVLVCHSIILFTGPNGFSQWSENHEENNMVISAPGRQNAQAITTDGSGGAIICWWDYRSETNDYNILAQRIDSTGSVRWSSGGIAICNDPAHQQNPVIASDGKGGALISWFDRRSGKNEVFVQRVNSLGEILWETNGQSVGRVENHYQHGFPSLTGDGNGGAYVAWDDWRGTLYEGIRAVYVQHFSPEGSILFGEGGIPVSAGAAENPQIINDGMGNALVCWYEVAGASPNYTYSVLAQKIGPDGTPAWQNNGIVLCSLPGMRRFPKPVPDGSGGAIIVWEDLRQDASHTNIYTQRINASGEIMWGENGLAIAPAALAEVNYWPHPDGQGGAFYVWQFSINNIYVQYVNAEGVPQWGTMGKAMSTAGDGRYPHICGDSGDGVYVTWHDFRGNGGSDIYAQRVDREGNLYWDEDGVLVSGLSSSQYDPKIISDGYSGAVIAWSDERNMISSDVDIYAQHLNADGSLGGFPPGNVKVPLLQEAEMLGESYPNPASDETFIPVRLVANGKISLKLMNSVGQEVAVIFDGKPGPGAHTFRLNTSGLAPGMYYYRLDTEEKAETRILIITR